MINAASFGNNGRTEVTITPAPDREHLGWDPSADPLPFTPQDWDNPEFKPQSMELADEVLLHELVHAMRSALNVRTPDSRGFNPPPRPDQDYGNRFPLEELYAIVITNVYRSENHRPGLRRDHNDPKIPLPPDLRNPSAFAALWLSQLTRLRMEMVVLFRIIAAVRCEFNPLARV
jgi:hypothetical protein